MKKQLNLSIGGRKLSLSKKTISNLTASEMSKHLGGMTGTCGHVCDHETKGAYCHTYGNGGNTCDGHKTCYIC